LFAIAQTITVQTQQTPEALTASKEIFMNIRLRIMLSGRLCAATITVALLVASVASQAQNNTAYGYRALSFDTTGSGNSAFGGFALFLNTTGGGNSAFGNDALFHNDTGYNNTATGFGSLFYNTTGFDNTAAGYDALFANSYGYANTAAGYDALYANTTGFNNTANGDQALYTNTTGADNTANGANTLASNTSGSLNTANGYAALYTNSTGYSNVASGYKNLFYNTTGSENTAYGTGALFNNTTGSFNIALGSGAGRNITTGNNNIAIGNAGLNSDNGVIRLGAPGVQHATFIAGIDGATSPSGLTVFIDANGQLGTRMSSRRFKSDIHDMGQVSDRLMQLRPVTFRYKQGAADGSHPLQYGLIAEEVAKVYPDLVQYDKNGKPLAIYDHQLAPMLLNELQKAHRQNQAQKTEIAALKSEVTVLKQSQEQQQKALTKLTALVEASQNKVQSRQAVAMRH
jgi:hypothetical protein